MIVVDTNIICYRYMASRHSEAANAAWATMSIGAPRLCRTICYVVVAARPKPTNPFVLQANHATRVGYAICESDE